MVSNFLELTKQKSMKQPSKNVFQNVHKVVLSTWRSGAVFCFCSLVFLVQITSAKPLSGQVAEAPELDGQPPAPATSPILLPEFQELFDGKSLDGWTQRGGQAEFRVEEGAIVGKTRIATPNSFLCTEDDFGDFELELEFKLDNDRLNSGVQIRSSSKPEYKNGRVHGYQVEIDPTSRGWTGGIYDEARRGWLYPVKNKPEAQSAFRLGQWNKMRVVAQGNSIKTWINEIAVADLVDDVSPKGFIALQVHSSNEVMPMEIRWRNIRIKPLEVSEPTGNSTVETTNSSSDQ